MKRIYLILLVLFPLAFGTPAWGICPQNPNDRGICDTMYVQPWDADTLIQGNGPYFVRVPIYVTADVADDCDSISAFVIPLCYIHSNPAKYCSLSAYWNRILWSQTNLPRSIFRHLVTSSGDTIHNWMMDQYEEGLGEEWNYIQLNLDGTSHFWLSLVPTGTEDQRFGSGSRILLTTMTFNVKDTMQICIDTCFWPPTSHLGWAISDTFQQGYCGTVIEKIPRPGTDDPNSFEVCFSLRSFIQYLTDTLTVVAFSPVDLIVTDAVGDSIGLGFNSIPGASYDTTRDYNHDGDKDDIVTFPNRLVSNYMIRVFSEPVVDKATYSLGIRIDGGAMMSIGENLPVPNPGEADTFLYDAPWYLSGDANGDWIVDVGDVVYLINYLYKGGVSPEPVESGDATCEGFVDVGDVVYLINYLFKGGLPPSC